jgi:hypothetical protein
MKRADTEGEMNRRSFKHVKQRMTLKEIDKKLVASVGTTVAG